MANFEGATSTIYDDVTIPQPSKNLKELITKLNKANTGIKSDAQLFYDQAVSLVDYEDNCPNDTPFFKLTPTYANLTLGQLRGYFTWRTRVRHGLLENCPMPYALLYCYELLNQIGVTDPDTGFQQLVAFMQNYESFLPNIKPFLHLWLKDYVLFYDLDPQLLADILPDANNGQNLLPANLLNLDQIQDLDVIFATIMQMASYKLTDSIFFQKEPEAVKAVVCQVFTTLWQQHAQQNRGELLFGEYHGYTYMLFKGAVFANPHRPKKGYRFLPNGDCYEYIRSEWRIIKWDPLRTTTALNALLKACESRMREAFNFKRKIKAPKVPTEFTRCIETVLAQYLQAQQVQKQAAIKIDRSKLNNIRAAALDTQQKLLVDSEEEEPVQPITSLPKQKRKHKQMTLHMKLHRPYRRPNAVS